MSDDIFANGVSADTGRPLPAPPSAPPAADVRESAAVVKRGAALKDATAIASSSVGADFDASDLKDVGWALIFPAEGDPSPIEAALKPLIDLRREQVGDPRLFKIFKGAAGYRADESAVAWLSRQGDPGPGLDVVNPLAGAPYYLLIVASPETIPMTFQYTLDLYWAVGRVFFPTLDEYARYAGSVKAYETAAAPTQPRKRLGMFATAHPFDAATNMFMNGVARPFKDGDGLQGALGRKQKFGVDALFAEAATKQAFTDMLRGAGPSGPPALLFTGSHGMAFLADDNRLAACQGALVCQDWEGYGSIAASDWFAAEDLPADARIHGMVHFMFACYGCGWEKVDTFRTGPGGVAAQIAPAASVARLPQAMLAHGAGGALAVIGHVDRAWSYSFKTADGGQQSTGMRDVLTGVMKGMRLGHATDLFNMRWAALATSIADALRDGQPTGAAAADLAKQWIARDDARNYAIFGDPAVRLRTDAMTDQP